jgi:hypothetical protein
MRSLTLLGVSAGQDAAAKNCKKIKDKKKRKKCLAQAASGGSATCTPACGGKQCGDDGCAGS